MGLGVANDGLGIGLGLGLGLGTTTGALQLLTWLL